MKRNGFIYLLMFFLGVIALVAGWRLFWFLCDDAYIAFRYVSNSMLGFGYVWNPPPFWPVEGYTSFLWVVLLDGCWRIFYSMPPTAANYLSLLFSIGTLGVGSLLLFAKKNFCGRLGLFYYGAFLIAVVTNRTFLAWSSSGLETAMFNFFVMLWVYCCRRLPVPGTGWMTLASVAAAMIALTRPDGLLFCGMTLIVWLIASDRTLLSKKTLRGAAAIAPLAVVAVHLAWRHSFYGEWVPNTYFAKYTGAWPTAGARYLFSFVMEYCLWTWIIVAVGVVIAQWVSSNARKKQSTVAPVGKSEELIARRVMTAVAVALFLHAGYYTFVIGGDHFEYRVYSHLVPLLWISFFWMIGKANFRPELTIGIVCIAVGLSWPVPWSHFVLSRDRLTREQTLMMRVPVAPSWPVAVRWYARLFDNSQAWLISHFLCVRQEEHSICSSWWMQDMLPSRNEGEKIGGEEFPVMAAGGGIGGLGWVLPHVNFIDCYGLNDYVVARSAVVRSRDRLMAHDRVAPEKYVQAFRPNVALEPGKVTVAVKDHPLTESEIMAIETKWRRFMRK